MKKEISIAYGLDSNYVFPASVSIYSLLKNTKVPEDIHIYIIYDDTKGTNLDDIEEVIRNFNAKFTRIDIDGDLLKGYKLRFSLTRVTYARWYLHELLPKVNKCIYLDTDTLILGDIKELWDFPIENYPLGAIHDKHMVVYESLYGIPNSKCFNAGVLIINLYFFRQYNCLNQLKVLNKVHQGKIHYADQDAMNILFNNSWIRIPDEWNVLCMGEYLNKKGRWEGKILHFVGFNKPWIEGFLKNRLTDPYELYYNERINLKGE